MRHQRQRYQLSRSASHRKALLMNLSKEVIEHEELFIGLHDHLPKEMVYERELLICRL